MNYEIPASEIKTIESDLKSHLKFLKSESKTIDNDYFEFPLFFALEYNAISRWFKYNNYKISNYYIVDSESDDYENAPSIKNLLFSSHHGEGYFIDKNSLIEFQTFNTYSTFFEIEINNKPALFIFQADGTTGQSFSQTSLIFHK